MSETNTLAPTFIFLYTKGRTKKGRPDLTHFSKTLILDYYITLLSLKQSHEITFPEHFKSSI